MRKAPSESAEDRAELLFPVKAVVSVDISPTKVEVALPLPLGTTLY